MRLARPRIRYAWWSGVVLMPLWLGWAFGSLGTLQARQMADAHQQATTIAAAVLARLGSDFAGGQSMLVAIEGHRCSCGNAADDARWRQALLNHPGELQTFGAPGASFSLLAFDGDGRLLYAGSPASAGCGDDPARLLTTVLDASTPPTHPLVAPCFC